MSTKRAIKDRLSDLVGMPMWAVGRAASLVWIQFGDRLVAKSPLGHTREVGTYALHIDCPWSWRRDHEVLADNDTDLEQLQKLASTPIICKGVSAFETGSFVMRFENGTKLMVSVDDDPDADEYWRLFEPAIDSPHFVVGPRGVSA